MRALLFLPAIAITLGAVALTAVFAVVPAVSTTDYLNVERGAQAGDLAILGGVEPGTLRSGDVVAARFVDRPAQPYTVVGRQDGSVLLTSETESIVIVAPEGLVARRLTDTVGGLGDVYGYVDSAAGWGTIAAATLGAWLLTLGLLRMVARRPERAFASAERALGEPPSVPVRAVAPVPDQAPAAAPGAAAAASPEPVTAVAPPADDVPTREPIPFPTARATQGAVDDLVLDLARQVARQAPQAGLRHARRVTELSTRKQTLGWAGLAATAAAVAAATYLVAAERSVKAQPKQRSKKSGRRRWI